jgi:hypothetical protein
MIREESVNPPCRLPVTRRRFQFQFRVDTADYQYVIFEFNLSSGLAREAVV